MQKTAKKNKICVVIGASHAGVNVAFALRREGWQGEIMLFDSDTELPYHRPPLSKTYLTNAEHTPLKAEESYEREGIQLHLGVNVTSIARAAKHIVLDNGSQQAYDTLILATGARPIIPSILGLAAAKNVFTLRTAADVTGIRNALGTNPKQNIVVIGGGYIGLEIAASLKQLSTNVTILEREERVLARVTAPEMSDFFHDLHAKNGVKIVTGKNVTSVETQENHTNIICSDGTNYPADIIIIGVGIHVNKELAKQAGLTIENGVMVDSSSKTSNEHIYAVGDCTFHHNPHYNRYIRLESVQHAIEQGKIAAATICGKKVVYDNIPWFWSDQYNIKLQIVGLSEGYDNLVIRTEEKEQPCFSIWYFKANELLSVDAVNNAKAYVIGTKLIKTGTLIDRKKLMDNTVELKPDNLV